MMLQGLRKYTFGLATGAAMLLIIILQGFHVLKLSEADFMIAITAAVRRGAPNVCLVADMPFLSYQVGINEAIKNAGRFVTQCGAQIVKIEASQPYLPVVKAVSDAGIAVMAHIGIRPQSISKMGRFKAYLKSQTSLTSVAA